MAGKGWWLRAVRQTQRTDPGVRGVRCAENIDPTAIRAGSDGRADKRTLWYRQRVPTRQPPICSGLANPQDTVLPRLFPRPANSRFPRLQPRHQRGARSRRNRGQTRFSCRGSYHSHGRVESLFLPAQPPWAHRHTAPASSAGGSPARCWRKKRRATFPRTWSECGAAIAVGPPALRRATVPVAHAARSR